MAAPVVSKPAILLIHGLWMTPLCWEEWIVRYTKEGYTVLAPGWPGIDDRTPEAIRKDPSALKGLTIHDIIDNYVKIINGLETKPIIMGHSFGGLFVQILISRGMGAVGVGICPAQPAGVIALKPSTIKVSWGILGNPLTFNEAVPFTEKQFHYAFGNHLPEPESKKLWERYSIPSAAHVLWQGVLAAFNTNAESHVDFNDPDRKPLLLMAGSKDHVVPMAVVEAEKKHYKGPAIVDVKIWEGKTHGIVNQDGWEEVADYALKWAEEHTK